MMIRFQLTEDEIVRGKTKYLFLRLRRKFWLWIVVFACGVGIIVSSFLSSSAGKRRQKFDGVLVAGGALTALVLPPVLGRRAVRRMVRSNPAYTSLEEVVIDENGLVASGLNRKVEFRWPAFRKLTEDDRFYYLHTNDLGSVELLPKRAFDDAGRSEFLRCSRVLPHL